MAVEDGYNRLTPAGSSSVAADRPWCRQRCAWRQLAPLFWLDAQRAAGLQRIVVCLLG